MSRQSRNATEEDGHACTRTRKPRLRVAGRAVCERAACSGIPTAQLFSDWIKNALENVMPEGLVEVKVANEEDRKGSTRAGKALYNLAMLPDIRRWYPSSRDGVHKDRPVSWGQR
jgi:hypothetical protein